MPLNPDVEKDSMRAFSIVLVRTAENFMPYRTRFIMFGSEFNKQYMVVTQRAPFSGWKGIDPELIPNFKEGEREAVARDFLEAQGKFTLSFTLTRLDALNTLIHRCH